MHTTLARTDRKMALDLKAVAGRTLAHETLVQGQHFLLHGEELPALHVGEGFGAVQREHFARALAYGRAGGGGYGEAVAGEGEDFFFHLESAFGGGVEGWVGGLGA